MTGTAFHQYHLPKNQITAGKREGFATDDWDVQREARQFLGLVRAGQMTAEEARLSILMTREQLQRLIGEHIAPRDMLIKIFRKRRLTCRRFLRMYRKEMAGKIAA
jgi:hypothetical protein